MFWHEMKHDSKQWHNEIQGFVEMLRKSEEKQLIYTKFAMA